jgi:hypothetical protein
MTVKTRLRDWHGLQKKGPMPEVGNDVPDLRRGLTERSGNTGGMTRIHSIHYGLGLA